MIKTAIRESFPNTIAAPYLCIAATDSKHFKNISRAILRFVPFTDLEGYHGIDERISVKQFIDAINFYHHFIEKL